VIVNARFVPINLAIIKKCRYLLNARYREYRFDVSLVSFNPQYELNRFV